MSLTRYYEKQINSPSTMKASLLSSTSSNCVEMFRKGFSVFLPHTQLTQETNAKSLEAVKLNKNIKSWLGKSAKKYHQRYRFVSRFDYYNASRVSKFNY